jgi:SAM-dependent methyltransferase
MLNFLAWLTMDYDAYERHSVVGRLLRAAHLAADACVLDVGGRAALLGQFTPYRVVAVNVDGSGDVLYAGGSLPFADCACEAVVSLDTLEHLPRAARLPFLRECLRVAGRRVIVAAPWGSLGHSARERELNARYRELHGRTHVYLNEHVRYGLPDADEMAVWLAALDVRGASAYFAGDYVWQSRRFERVMRASLKPPGGLTGIHQLVLHLSARAVWHPVRLRSSPAPTTNRFYLVLER